MFEASYVNISPTGVFLPPRMFQYCSAVMLVVLGVLSALMPGKTIPSLPSSVLSESPSPSRLASVNDVIRPPIRAVTRKLREKFLYANLFPQPPFHFGRLFPR